MDLHLQNLDFHYHAGQERSPDVSLRDHLDHAQLTGRRVLGVTDHLQFYWPRSSEESRFPYYPASIDGLAQYRNEVAELAPQFPRLRVLFGPEVPPKCRLADIPKSVLAISDFFICEHAFRGDDQALVENTELFINRLAEVKSFVKRTGKPTFLAHPFRLSVNHRLVKRRIEPWVTEMTPRPDGRFGPKEISRFFLLDVVKIAHAAADWEVPLEINGCTEERVRASNLPVALQLLRAAYRVFRDAGVRFVPGSDQHGFTSAIGRMGSYVPYETFEQLGVEAKDIQFARALWED